MGWRGLGCQRTHLLGYGFFDFLPQDHYADLFLVDQCWLTLPILLCAALIQHRHYGTLVPEFVSLAQLFVGGYPIRILSLRFQFAGIQDRDLDQ